MIIQTFIYSEHQLWYLVLSENICISQAFRYKLIKTIKISNITVLGKRSHLKTILGAIKYLTVSTLYLRGIELF
jgi:hypothetical protein